MDLARITEIVDRLAGSAVRDLRVRSGEMDIRITFADVVPATGPMPMAAANTFAVEAPVPGLVYLSPEPGSPAYVKVGDHVREGQTLLLIEAMKSMLTVTAPSEGIVAEVCVCNETQVGPGDILLQIKGYAA